VKKQRKQLGSGAIADGETYAKNASVEIILLSRKSTKIGKKLAKARKIAKSSLKHFKTTLKGFFERFLSI
jgi:hypothetical protein